MTATAAAIVIGYLCGSLLPGFWIGKYILGKDIRAQGSGNIGATNAFRVLGPVAGSIVLLLDVAKGAIAVLIARAIDGDDALAGLAAIVGHVWSPFLKFSGGKGVATGLGVFLALALYPTLAAVAVFAAVLALSRRVSPSSCAAAVTLGAAMPFSGARAPVIAVAEIVVVLVIVRHRSNIARLFRGEEPRTF